MVRVVPCRVTCLSHTQAVATTASLAGQYSSRVTVLFVDEEGKELDASSRIEQIKGYGLRMCVFYNHDLYIMYTNK